MTITDNNINCQGSGVWYTAPSIANQRISTSMFDEIETIILQEFEKKAISIENARIILNQISERLKYQTIHTKKNNN